MNRRRDIIVQRDVEAVMRDGVVLRADVYRPDDGDRHPVLLARLPYDKSNIMHRLLLDTDQAIDRGYMVIIQDSRGRFTSEGQWLPWHFETQDGFDTVQWAAELPFSNGEVGMWGASYFGNTQWRAAIAKPPALRAIAPAVTWATPTDGLYLRGGAPEHGLNLAWGLETGLSELSRVGASADAVAELVSAQDSLADGGYLASTPGVMPLRHSPELPDIGLRRFLQDPSTADESEVAAHLADVTVPAMHLGGWYDIFLQGTLDTFTRQHELGVPSRLVVGPWTHAEAMPALVGERYFGLASSGRTIGMTESRTSLQLDFFDEHVRRRVPAEPHAPVRIFVMGLNQWRDEAEWPLARAVATPLYFAPGGSLQRTRAAEQEIDSYKFDSADPTPTRGGNIVMHPMFPAGVFDQCPIEERKDLLNFTSRPLARDLEVTGAIEATLFGSSSARSSDWVVRLSDVLPDGRSYNVADGILRAEPGAEHHLIRLWSTSNVFMKGHRIRVTVSSASFPRWGLNPDMVARGSDLVQTVKFGGNALSCITLPVVGDEPTFVSHNES